jgi:NAD(P)-dependent dehydrogenase (short-subunit alcohol dehydrogenase family)
MSANTAPRVILTGASRGLGLATLKLLLERHNARVATLSRSYPDALKDVVNKYGEDRVLVVQGDISKPEDNAKVVKSAVDSFGGIDSVILNAGSLEPIGQFFFLLLVTTRLTAM